MARILYAWSPSWAVSTWRRRNASAPADGPFALIANQAGVRRLAAVDDAAAALGLFVGQKATDAAALVPELTSADHDPAGDLAALRALADWCVRFSPAVALDPPDGLVLDVTGVDHLWGGEAAMAGDLTRRLAANGLPVRCAVADTLGAAWALARFGGEGRIAPPAGQAAWLDPLPVTALRLAAQDAAQLARLGLTTIARLRALPRDQLGRRFGAGLLLRLDQALGTSGEAAAFRRPPTPWVERLAFLEPISTPEDLARVAADIAAALCRRLEAEGRGARRFELFLHRLDGRAPSVAAGLSRAGRQARVVARLLTPKLEAVDPGFGFEAATLAAYAVERLDERQTRLDDDQAAAAQDGLAALIDRLTARLGEARFKAMLDRGLGLLAEESGRLGEAGVFRPQSVQTHVPERCVGRGRPMTLARADWRDAPRPVRLLRRPEPIEALALLPDDPPTRFRWRGRPHVVRLAEGPERIAGEWWRRPLDEVRIDQVRDYYRVEDEAGGRFWIFRSGLYGVTDTPRWFLHGLFA